MEDCWINLALRNQSPNVKHLCVDGRYNNEAKRVAEIKGLNVVVWRKGHENDDNNRSESEILKIVKWCLDTEQNGVIDHKRKGFLETPEGIENYHYFIRNDGSRKDLYYEVSVNLINFIESKMN